MTKIQQNIYLMRRKKLEKESKKREIERLLYKESSPDIIGARSGKMLCTSTNPVDNYINIQQKSASIHTSSLLMGPPIDSASNEFNMMLKESSFQKTEVKNKRNSAIWDYFAQANNQSVITPNLNLNPEIKAIQKQPFVEVQPFQPQVNPKRRKPKKIKSSLSQVPFRSSQFYEKIWIPQGYTLEIKDSLKKPQEKRYPIRHRVPRLKVGEKQVFVHGKLVGVCKRQE